MSNIILFIERLKREGFNISASGDELRVRSKDPRKKLSQKQRLFIKNSKAELLHLLNCNNKAMLVKANRSKAIPLSFSQESLWFIDRYQGGESDNYHVPLAFQMSRDINIEILSAAFSVLIERHEILRTKFKTDLEGNPYQVIIPFEELPKFSLTVKSINKCVLKSILKKESHCPFDLEQHPLFRVSLFDIGTEFVLLVTQHHIISDAWSIGVFLEELSIIYKALVKRVIIELPPLLYQYADYAVWQRQHLSGERFLKQVGYWKESLTGFEMTEILSHRPRPALQTFNGANVDFKINVDVHQKIKALMKKTNSTLYVVLLAAFYWLLNLYTNQEDLLIASPLANRSLPEVESIMGFFVNTLPFRVRFDQSKTGYDFIQIVKELCLEVYDHQDLPFEKIVEILGIKRNASYSPVFQIMFVLQNAVEETTLLLDKVEITPYDFDYSVAKFDLTLALSEKTEGIDGVLEYNTDLYEEEFVQRMVDCYQLCLNQLVSEPDRVLGSQSLVSLPDYFDFPYREISSANDINVQCLHQAFEVQAAMNPSALAVSGKSPLTYQSLNSRANQLAHYLEQTHQEKYQKALTPGALIPVLLPQNSDMLVAIVAILKVGGAYVPLDPLHPDERIDYVLSDVKAPLVITNEILGLRQCLSGSYKVSLDQFTKQFHLSSDNLVLSINPEQVAYVIYTSGSTGKPKGVEVSHASAINYLNHCANAYPLNVGDKVPFFSSPAVDMSITSLFHPLMSSATIQLLEVKEPSQALFEIFFSQQIYGLIKLTPSHLRLVNQVMSKNKSPSNAYCQIRQLVVGGEALLQEDVNIFLKYFPQTILFNEYGPTEATVGCIVYQAHLEPDSKSKEAVPIGRPIKNAKVYVLNKALEPVPQGVPGELYLGGRILACGYLNHSELSKEHFIQNPFSYSKEDRLYKTGDQVCWLKDGNLVYLGRYDHQVKLKGYRVELGEIESTLKTHPSVSQSVVALQTFNLGEKTLCAYVIKAIGAQIEPEQLRQYLLNKLPSYMVPIYFLELSKFPVDAAGKLDYRALPLPSIQQVQQDNTDLSMNELERDISKVWCRILGLGSAKMTMNFFEAGGDSLSAVKLQIQLNKEMDLELKVIDIFTYSTIELLAAYILEGSNTENSTLLNSENKQESLQSEAIAIIGYSGAFSGSDSIASYWQQLLTGQEGVSHLTLEECSELGIPASLSNQENYIASEGLLDEAAYFDADFWGVSPREAELLDPQIRRFLEHSWQALEEAGYIQQRAQLSIGVFAGAGNNGYLFNNIMSHSDKNLFEGNLLGNKDFLASRTAYHLNLKGPVFNLYTACSTSLVAVSEACDKLLLSKCDMALAGGATLQLPEKFGYVHAPGLINSSDGHSYVFDEQANGTVSGSGVGVVVLKRLSKAEQDGDNILAVIRGHAINNDGRQKVGYTAPSVQGQKACILAAQRVAGISADDIDYVECHGTATELGDPIEIEALELAFKANSQGSRNKPCILGGVKANIGHTDVAAGMAGLMKVSKMLQEKIIPPQIHFNKPNPQLSLDTIPFSIVTEPSAWEAASGKARLAGISSFGIGGTNAHVILEEAPVRSLPASQREARSSCLVTLSAKNEASLLKMKLALIDYLQLHPDVSMQDVAYTLQTRREVFEHRYAVVSQNRKAAIANLSDRADSGTVSNLANRATPQLVFMCSGVGEHYIDMGRGLYDSEPCYREVVDACCEIVSSHFNVNFLTILYPELDTEDAKKAVNFNQTSYVHAAVFITGYATARLLISWGIKPSMLIGHSIGEYLAACLAGVFGLEDALRLVVKRAQIINALPTGGMVAIPMGSEAIKPFLNNQLSLAAINGPSLSVVSGESMALEALAKTLLAEGLVSIPLPVTHAFHSHMMSQAKEALLDLFASVEYSSPTTPYVSNVTGQSMTADEVKDPHYWYRHTCETVQFSKGIQSLIQQRPETIFIEIGPGANLTSAVLQHQTATIKLKNRTVNIIKNRNQTDIDDVAFLQEGLSKLWLQGVTIDWVRFYEDRPCRFIPLPTYAFAKEKYWLSPNQNQVLSATGPGRLPMKEWFYEPTWQQSILPDVDSLQKCYLIFNNTEALTQTFIADLLHQGHDIYYVEIGEEYHFSIDKKLFTISLDNKLHYEAIFSELNKQQVKLDHIIHTWLLSSKAPEQVLTKESAEYCQRHGFYALLYIVQGLLFNQLSQVKLSVISNGLYSVYGDEVLYPEKATILGLLKCIPQEYPEISCNHIEVSLNQAKLSTLSESLLRELQAESNEVEIAYRNGKRWLKTFTKMQPLLDTVPRYLKSRGVYLITGGLGKVGSLLAQYLAKTVQARLVMLVRTQLPPASQWEDWLLTHDAEDSISKKLNTIKKIKAYGSEVIVIQGDVSSQQDVERAAEVGVKTYGSINGVIHMAGVTDPEQCCNLQQTTAASIDPHFNSKIYGLLYIKEIVEQDNISFCLLTSSLAPILGGLNFGAYAAANTFMDVFVDKQVAHSDSQTDWLTFNMDGWEDSSDSPDIKQVEADAYFDAYFKSFSKAGQVVTSTEDLDYRRRRWVKFETNERSSREAQQLYSRPTVKTDYIAPITEIEKRLEVLWKEVLGIDCVGIDDCFFDLGGNSLTATYLLSKIRSEFKQNLSVQIVFENRTIRKIASIIGVEEVNPIVCFNQGDSSQAKMFFVHPGEAGVEAYIGLSKLLPEKQPFYAVENYNLYVDDLMIASLEELASKYVEQLLLIDSVGPFYLGGWSLGGIIAYEMAKQLNEKGIVIKHLFMLDSFINSPEEIRLHLELPSYFEAVLKEATQQRQGDGAEYWERVHSVMKVEEKMVFEYKYPPSDMDGAILFKATMPNQYSVAASSEQKVLLEQIGKLKTGKSANGWENVIPNMNVIELACHHHSLMEGEHLKKVVNHINSILND
jgi:amino acid adenylation domain-containing protein